MECIKLLTLFLGLNMVLLRKYEYPIWVGDSKSGSENPNFKTDFEEPKQQSLGKVIA